MKRNKKRTKVTEGDYNSPLLATHDFWGLPKPKPIDPTVYVHTDISVLKYGKLKPSKLHDLDEEEMKKVHDNYTTRVQKMAAIKAQDKERRLHALKHAIDSGEVKTVQDALRATPEIKSDKTIHSYLKIIGRKLKDEVNGRYYGSDAPNFGLLDKNNSKEKVLGTQYKYYDTDPSKGGREITQEEYKALRQELLAKYGGR